MGNISIFMWKWYFFSENIIYYSGHFHIGSSEDVESIISWSKGGILQDSTWGGRPYVILLQCKDTADMSKSLVAAKYQVVWGLSWYGYNLLKLWWGNNYLPPMNLCDPIRVYLKIGIGLLICHRHLKAGLPGSLPLYQYIECNYWKTPHSVTMVHHYLKVWR